MPAARSADADEPAPAPPRTELSAALREEVYGQFAAIEREVARLRQAGAKKEAEELARQLRRFRDRLDGKAAADGDRPELHVVGIHAGKLIADRGPHGTAVVEVHVTDRPVVLALCASNPVKWTLRVGKGVKLQKVVLGGFREQELEQAPQGVPLEKHTRDGKSPDFFFACEVDHYGHYAQAARTLKKLTGLDISTFQGASQYRGVPFVVGPSNADWEARRLLADMRPVYRAATALERARQREAVQAIRFRAIWFSPTDQPRHFDKVANLAEFTPLGPIATTVQPLHSGRPLQTSHVAVDPKGPAHYAISASSVVRLDVRTGQTTELSIDPKLPRLSHPCGLTFDTKRRRLVLTSFGGVGHMYAYAPDEDKWSLIADMDNIDLQSFTFAAEEDCFYGLENSHGSRPFAIYRFNSAGKREGKLQPSEQIPMDRDWFHSPTQLVAAGRQLALLTSPMPDPIAPELPPRCRCYLIDPRTGKVTYSGVMEPHPGIQKFTAKALGAMWQALAAGDPLEADQVMWKLAAGGEPTVALLRSRFPPIKAPDMKRIGTLIKQLDDNQFRVREAATAELQRLGIQAEPALRDALDRKPSAEARRRIQDLRRQVEQGESRNPEIRREQRAIRVLARMATPAAVEYLRELAAGPAGTWRTREATLALEQVGRR